MRANLQPTAPVDRIKAKRNNALQDKTSQFTQNQWACSRHWEAFLNIKISRLPSATRTSGSRKDRDATGKEVASGVSSEMRKTEPQPSREKNGTTLWQNATNHG